MRYFILLPCFTLLWSIVAHAQTTTVTDLIGRQVTLDVPVKRMVLADSRMLLPMSLLHPGDSLKNIVAWDDALQSRAPDMRDFFTKAFPKLNRIPVFANPYRSAFNVEQISTLKPDVIIFDIGIFEKLRDEGALNLLEKSRIPVIFIDFRQKPLENTAVSLRLLGKITGEQANAEHFIQHWQQLLRRVRLRIAKLPSNDRPGVIFENHAGMNGAQCCTVFGRNTFGALIPEAGGRNLMAQKVPPQGAEINPELLIMAQADFYLLSGADWRQNGTPSQAVPLGYNANRQLAKQRLDALLQRPIISVLPVVQNKKVLALYHQFYDSPFNVIALEVMAKLFHPELFRDVAPQADLEMLYKDYVGLPYQGLFFIQP
jgi:iron complex transport system substrate-binding protein